MKQRIYVCAIMLLLFILVASCSVPEWVTDTSAVERSFTISGPPSIELRSMPGDLQIVAGEAERVQVFAELVGADTSQERAQKSRETLSLDFSQEGDTIRVVGDRNIVSGVEGNAWINYVITVPLSTTLNIQMNYDSNVSTDIGIAGVLIIVLLAISGAMALLSIFLWARLHKAQTQIRKLDFGLRATRGEAHMRDLERKWTNSVRD